MLKCSINLINDRTNGLMHSCPKLKWDPIQLLSFQGYLQHAAHMSTWLADAQTPLTPWGRSDVSATDWRFVCLLFWTSESPFFFFSGKEISTSVLLYSYGIRNGMKPKSRLISWSRKFWHGIFHLQAQDKNSYVSYSETTQKVTGNKRL